MIIVLHHQIQNNSKAFIVLNCYSLLTANSHYYEERKKVCIILTILLISKSIVFYSRFATLWLVFAFVGSAHKCTVHSFVEVKWRKQANSKLAISRENHLVALIACIRLQILMQCVKWALHIWLLIMHSIPLAPNASFFSILSCMDGTSGSAHTHYFRTGCYRWFTQANTFITTIAFHNFLSLVHNTHTPIVSQRSKSMWYNRFAIRKYWNVFNVHTHTHTPNQRTWMNCIV